MGGLRVRGNRKRGIETSFAVLRVLADLVSRRIPLELGSEGSSQSEMISCLIRGSLYRRVRFTGSSTKPFDNYL